tara:strand:+ start:514 stop:897 length:384 start_codon:yes stop_codon:yes gene_type:complete
MDDQAKIKALCKAVRELRRELVGLARWADGSNGPHPFIDWCPSQLAIPPSPRWERVEHLLKTCEEPQDVVSPVTDEESIEFLGDDEEPEPEEHYPDGTEDDYRDYPDSHTPGGLDWWQNEDGEYRQG